MREDQGSAAPAGAAAAEEALRYYEVRIVNAFPAPFKPDDEARVRRILGGAGRGAWAGSGPPRPCHIHALAHARCGYELQPGQRCGRRVKAFMRDEARKQFDYNGPACRFHRQPHWTRLPRETDDQVLDALLAVFRKDMLQRFARDFRLESADIAAQRRAQQKVVADRRKDAEAVDTLEQNAQRDLTELQRQAAADPTTVSAEQMQEARETLSRKTQRSKELWRQVRQAERALADHDLRIAEFVDVAEKDLERIVKLATDLPLLIERVREIPDMLARITEALVEKVFLSRLADGVFRVDLVFPSGREVSRIFRQNVPAAEQPLRLYVFERMKAGAAVEEIAAEIDQFPGHWLRKSKAWTPERVRALGLVYEHFDVRVERQGPHETIAAIARRIGEELGHVSTAAYWGRLGPARWNGKTVEFQPTDDELHRTFPDYALRATAAHFGLDAAALIPVRDLAGANPEMKAAEIEWILKSRVQVFRDARGRRYALREELLAQGLSVETSIDQAAIIQEELRAAIASSKWPDLPVEEFESMLAATAELGRRFHSVTYERVKKATKVGHLPSVLILGFDRFGRRDRRLYVHLPPHVRSAKSRRVIERWLWANGREPRRGTANAAVQAGLRRARARRMAEKKNGGPPNEVADNTVGDSA